MKRHVTCFVEKAGFEPRTLGTKAERYDHCATRPVRESIGQARRPGLDCFDVDQAPADGSWGKPEDWAMVSGE